MVKRLVFSFFHIFVKNQNIPLVTKDENPIKDLRGRCLPIKGEGEGLGIEWCLFFGERVRGGEGRGMPKAKNRSCVKRKKKEKEKEKEKGRNAHERKEGRRREERRWC